MGVSSRHPAKPPRFPRLASQLGRTCPPLVSSTTSWRPLDQQYWGRLVGSHLLCSLGSPPDCVLIAATCRPRHGGNLRRRPDRRLCRARAAHWSHIRHRGRQHYRGPAAFHIPDGKAVGPVPSRHARGCGGRAGRRDGSRESQRTVHSSLQACSVAVLFCMCGQA